MYNNVVKIIQKARTSRVEFFIYKTTLYQDFKYLIFRLYVQVYTPIINNIDVEFQRNRSHDTKPFQVLNER